MKFLYLFLILLLLSCSNSNQALKNDIFFKALNNKDMTIRGNIVEISPNEYRLDYYDIYEEDSHFSFLNEKGFQGGGPTWHGIIYGAIQMSEPSIGAKIRLDDEGEGLAIWSSDKESLEKVGRLIAAVKSDESLMLKAIQIAEEDGEIE